jgi:hypothetical protein
MTCSGEEVDSLLPGGAANDIPEFTRLGVVDLLVVDSRIVPLAAPGRENVWLGSESRGSGSPISLLGGPAVCGL